MDTTGFSQVGRYGTISLMKRNEPDNIVTSFGIDSEELTFGRDPTCSVRLYYPDVGLTHCKIVFEERKAFLVVLGANGLLVDGCQVYPSQPPSGSPTTIPLPNNSEIEIHGKRFRFSYPSKELRSVLFSTPPRPQNRALRLSMIHSAQVFSPRPSHDPRENLRILQSPLKNTFKSPAKPSLLSRPPVNHTLEEEDEDEDEDIVLVDGDHPRVVEEERDLVILEDVEVALPSIQVHHPQPRTPKRSLSRNTLHRAVLIRSAQRAVWKAEKEREEEEEELEVLAHAVAAEEDSEEDEEQDYDERNAEQYDSEEEDRGEEEEEEYEEELKGDGEGEQPKSMWRKSLEKIWPFRSSSPTKEEQDAQDAQSESGSESETEVPDAHKEPMEVDEHDEDEESENMEQPAPLRSEPLQTPVRRPLGSFMTPQPQGHVFPTLSKDQLRSAGPARRSLAGEAQRVTVEQPWRVKDIVVPLNLNKGTSDTAGGSSKQTGYGQMPQASPMRIGGKPVLTEDEKKAIQERRRSALREVDTYFGGGVPGMTPSKPSSSSSLFRRSISPTKPSIRENPSARSSSPVKDGKARAGSADEDEELDTRSLLDRMKETVEGMKRRRSMVPSVSNRSGEGTPRSTVHATPRGSTEATPRTSFPSKLSPVIADAPVLAADEKDESEDRDNGAQDEEKENREAKEPFSLLRPGAREEVFARRQSIATLEVPEKTVSVEVRVEESNAMAFDDAPPAIVVQTAGDDAVLVVPNEVPEKPARGRGRAKFLRATKSPAPSTEETVEETQETQEDATRLRASTRRTPRLRTPQPEPTPAPEPVESVEQPDELVEEENVPTSLPVPRTAPRRGRKATAEPEETPAPPKRPSRKAAVEPEEPAPAPAPAKRGRKAIVEPEVESPVVEEKEMEKASAKRGRKPAAVKEKDNAAETVTPAPAPVKRGRKAAATPASEPAQRTEEPVVPQKGPKPKSAPVRKGRGTKIKPIELQDEEGDPLDSIGEIEASAPVVKPKGRKKAVIKQEEPEEADVGEDVPAPVATRSGRSKSVAKTSTVVPAKTPATKARAGKKAPATAPAAIEVDEVDKENTPGSGSGSGKSSPAEMEDRTGAVKVRVSRTRTTKTTTVTTKKAANVKEEEEEPARGRATRTRARTKTA